ncbi:MAG: hypothetical protein ABI639_10645, partial [Thermoanaerobaculia bacterium]
MKAVLTAPCVAAVAALPSWVVALLVDPAVTIAKSESSPTGIGATLEFVLFFLSYAFVIAAALELAVGLPLFLLFRLAGWTRTLHFLLGAILVAGAGSLWMNGVRLPESLGQSLLLLIPALVGSLAFGYAGGWLPNNSLQRTIGPAARLPLSS